MYQKADSTIGEIRLRHPHHLPDDRGIIYTANKANGSIDLVLRSDEIRSTLFTMREKDSLFKYDLFAPVYSPSGHILYQHGYPSSQGIWALPFSLDDLQITGAQFVVAANGAFHSVSREGTLVYESSVTNPAQRLVWVDREGNRGRPIGQPQDAISEPAISPDGRRVAVAGKENGNQDIWIHDERGSTIRLTTYPDAEWQPTWSPDGKRIAFGVSPLSTNTREDILTVAVDKHSAPVPLIQGPLSEIGPNWSRDGRYLAYHVLSDFSRDIRYARIENPGSNPTASSTTTFLETEFMDALPQISPNNRYVAYMSDETGYLEIYVRPFPSGEGRWPISINGGVHAKWRADGRELFYVEGDRLMAVPVTTDGPFEWGTPKPLFSGTKAGVTLFVGEDTIVWPRYDVAADGQRFIMIEDVGETPTVNVVQNWHLEFPDRGQE